MMAKQVLMRGPSSKGYQFKLLTASIILVCKKGSFPAIHIF